MQSKPWYSSKTIISALVGLIGYVATLCHVSIADILPALTANIGAYVNDTLTLAGFIGTIVGRIKAQQAITATKSQAVLANAGVKMAALIMVLCFALTGCGGTVPEQFDSPPAAAPLSAADQKIAITLANLDSSASLMAIETGAATATSLGMYVGITQPSTMQTDGQLLFGGGLSLQAFTTGTVPSTSAVGDIFSGLKTSASTQQSATNIATLGQSASGLLSSTFAWISNAAASTTDPDLKAYAAKVACDDLHALGKGICDATAKYATTPTPALAFDLRPVAIDSNNLVVYAF